MSATAPARPTAADVLRTACVVTGCTRPAVHSFALTGRLSGMRQTWDVCRDHQRVVRAAIVVLWKLHDTDGIMAFSEAER